MLRVEHIKSLKSYQLQIKLSNNTEGIFDVRPYLDKGIFTQLKDEQYFKKVSKNFAGICWPNGQDFSADTIACELKIN